MPTLRLSLACGDYDINQALVDGTETIQGAEVVVLTMSSPERHWRLMRHHEFDICEFSMASYLAMRDQQSDRYIAVPVFPHRRFRHSYVFVNRDAGISAPRDLEGRAVGLRTWQTTAGLWTRGILEDFYGVDVRSIDWVAQDEEDLPLSLADFRLRRVPEGQDVDRMLVAGELAGLIYPEIPPSFRQGDPRVRRLFRDAKAEEQRYFQATGIFPIMHTVVIREHVLEHAPWLAMNVVQAFRRSKARAWKHMQDPRRVSLAWFSEAFEEQRAILGPDPWPYDLASNWKAVDTLCEYAARGALTSRRLTPDELFCPGSIDDPPQYVGA